MLLATDCRQADNEPTLGQVSPWLAHALAFGNQPGEPAMMQGARSERSCLVRYRRRFKANTGCATVAVAGNEISLLQPCSPTLLAASGRPRNSSGRRISTIHLVCLKRHVFNQTTPTHHAELYCQHQQPEGSWRRSLGLPGCVWMCGRGFGCVAVWVYTVFGCVQVCGCVCRCVCVCVCVCVCRCV